MITEALLHFPGIGPIRLERLHASGVRTWTDIQSPAAPLPQRMRPSIQAEAERCLTALASDNIGYFVEQLHPKDRWRILANYLEQATFFDIETDGLEYDSRITVIACWHGGQIHSFVEGQNLDDFLALLERTRLLVSFNGNTFDVPHVLNAFHIPELPCPHLDLRWLCYHQGHAGGLKQITQRIGIGRPHDLQGVDGLQAVRLWMRWHHFDDSAALDELLRYCAADVVLSRLLALHLIGQDHRAHGADWEHLPGQASDRSLNTGHTADAASGNSPGLPGEPAPPAVNGTTWDFGPGSPHRLRARRRLA